MTKYKVTYWHPHCEPCKDRGVALGESLTLSLEECEALYDECPLCFRGMGAVEVAEKKKTKRKKESHESVEEAEEKTAEGGKEPSE